VKRGTNAEIGPKDFFERNTGSHFKNWILVQYQGGAEFQTAGILRYVEDLKRGTNAEIGPKDFFEVTSTRKATDTAHTPLFPNP
jgi:hypothetical protein